MDGYQQKNCIRLANKILLGIESIGKSTFLRIKKVMKLSFLNYAKDKDLKIVAKETWKICYETKYKQLAAIPDRNSEVDLSVVTF